MHLRRAAFVVLFALTGCEPVLLLPPDAPLVDDAPTRVDDDAPADDVLVVVPNDAPADDVPDDVPDDVLDPLVADAGPPLDPRDAGFDAPMPDAGIECAPGSAPSASGCAPCARGAYCPGGATPRQPCTGSWDHDADPRTSCVAWMDCPAGSFISSAGTATADRACRPCTAGTYSVSSNATSCAAWSSCSAGTEVAAPGSATTDRTCAACAAGSFSAVSNAESCTLWSTCAAGTRVLSAGSPTRDRSCAVCSAGSFSTTSNAAACTSWTACSPGSFVAGPGSVTSDQRCSACTAGTYTASPNLAACSPWSTCPPGTLVSAAGTAASDRVCAACPARRYSTTANASSCTAWTSCTAGTFVALRGTATADQRCDSCAPGTYSTSTDAAACSPFTRCAAGTFVSGEGSVIRDRMCTACAAGTFSSSVDAASCAAWSVCSAGTYVATAGTARNDRVCTRCAAGRFSTRTNASSCAPWTSCAPGFVESVAGSSTMDRTCAPPWSWVRTIGADDEESTERAVSVDLDASGDLYVAGNTTSSVDGSFGYGGDDAFVRSYGPSGTVLFTDQFGTSYSDGLNDLIVDRYQAIVAGTTGGALTGGLIPTLAPFVRGYGAGTALWTWQVTTPSLIDHGRGVAATIDAVYLVGSANTGRFGSTDDGFLIRFDRSDGDLVWNYPITSPGGNEVATAVCTDVAGDTVYVVGATDGGLAGHTSAGGFDAFVRGVQATGISGSTLFTHQFGTSDDDRAVAVRATTSGLYVLIQVESATDLYVTLRKIDPVTGTVLWSRDIRTAGLEDAADMDVDAAGNVYVLGGTSGALPGATSFGGNDVFVRVFDGDGAVLATHQVGTDETDLPGGIAVGPTGAELYVVGSTLGSFSRTGVSLAREDAFVMRL
jgi:hypothetical protein